MNGGWFVKQHTLAALVLATFGLATGATSPAAALLPQEVVKSTADQVLRVLSAEQKDLRQHPERIYDVVNEYILPNFSFEVMSRLVLGKHWRTASETQRDQFAKAFRTLLVRTYANSLLDYTDVPIRYLPVHVDTDAKDATVNTEVQQKGGAPMAISYRLRLLGGQWKVIDVVVEGVSLVTNYRSEFSTEISKAGLDGLISNLQTRNHEAGK